MVEHNCVGRVESSRVELSRVVMVEYSCVGRVEL